MSEKLAVLIELLITGTIYLLLVLILALLIETERFTCQVNQWQHQMLHNIKWQAAREAYV